VGGTPRAKLTQLDPSDPLTQRASARRAGRTWTRRKRIDDRVTFGTPILESGTESTGRHQQDITDPDKWAAPAETGWHPADMPFAAPMPAELAAGQWQLRILSDADWRLEWMMSRDPDVVRWTLYPPDMTEASALERICRTRQRANEQLAARYAVLDPAHAAVGTAGIASNENDPTEAEVFYALLPHGRHRGAATASARALCEWALSVGIEHVLLLTIPGNTASEAVAGRAGFLLDGEETRDHRGTPTRLLRWSRTASSLS